MKKCLYVGSFNPPTNAHIGIANYLLKQKIIDYLYFLPVNSSKTNLISLDKRINMLNLVKNKQEDVLNILNYQEKGFFNYDVLTKINLNITYLVMGSDLLLHFNTFLNYLDILNNYILIIIKRDNFDINSYLQNDYSNYLDRFIIIEKQFKGSSTDSRKSLNNIPKEVLVYIKNNNLYN